MHADDVIILGNVAMAALSAGVHGWAAVVVPARRDRMFHEAVALVASFYAIAYGALALDIFPITTWSPFMRGMSLLAWPLVWGLPAIREVHRWHHEQAYAVQIVEEAHRILAEAP